MLKHFLTYFLLFTFLLVIPIKSQSVYTLKVVNTDNHPLFTKLKYQQQFFTKDHLLNEIHKLYTTLIDDGYISASVDSIKNDSLNYVAFIVVGQKYRWANIRYDLKDQEIIDKLGYGERFFIDRPFSGKEISTLMEKIIKHYENNGFPFISAKLDSVNINQSIISAKLSITKNVFVVLDSLITEGSGKVNQKFLLRYLGIKHNMPYNAAAFNDISKKIKQLAFISEKKPAILQLTDKQNKLILFLDKKNASQFDGIVGVLPTNNGKTIFTGDLKIKLINSVLKSGETIDINWRRLQTQTQDLKATFMYPYIKGTPIGMDYAIKVYKKDTSFIDVNNSIGMNYYFNKLNFFKLFYRQRTANLISTSGLENITILPEYADVSTKSYGIGFFMEELDYKFNPKKGFTTNLQGSVGNRLIKKNPKINNNVYSNILLQTTQYQIEGNVTAYISLKKNHVLKISSQFGSVFGNGLYKNELFRIGGLKTLRGFDEESIYASSFIIPTLEYRFLFEKNSNLFLFSECAWYEKNTFSGYTKDLPVSVGGGINFETKAGIFNLTYAIGQQFGNGFDLRIGKIHAGLTSLF